MKTSPEQSTPRDRALTPEVLWERFEKGADESELHWILDNHNEALREMGIPVDDRGRMDPRAFEGIVEEETIENDVVGMQRVRERLEARAPSTPLSKLLEILKTVSVSRWDDDFIVVRTADVDDINSGVDEIIVDRQTGEPFAAFDDVVGEDIETKTDDSVIADRRFNGASVRYGFRLEEDRPQLAVLNELPLFIIAVEPDAVLQWAQSKEERMSATEREQRERAIRNTMIASLTEQAGEGSIRAQSDALKKKYKTLERRFRQWGEDDGSD